MRDIGRLVAPLLAGALLATTAAVPLLDRGPASRTPALETEHHPSTCHVGHDHRICVLVGASHWLDAGDDYRPPERLEVHGSGILPARDPLFSRSPTVHHSRAPPVV